MENKEGLGKMIKIHADTLWHRAERWYTPGRAGELGERFLPTLPGESRPSLPSCESHQSHRNWLTQNGWLTAIGIYFLISLKDRCPKSICQQGLLPLKALYKYSSLPLPGGSWQHWCSFPCSCVTPTSVPYLHALWSCVFVPFPLLQWTPVIEFQFTSVAQSCLTLCDPMNHSTPGLPVHHQLLEFTQTHVHRVGDAIQPSHPLSTASPLAFNLSQYQGLFKWISFSYQVPKVLEFQLQQQSFQWTPRTDLL